MSDLFKKALSLITGTPEVSGGSLLRMPKRRPLKKLTERELLRLESMIGAEIFGLLPKGHSRQFFCLDDATWIWHEAWRDKDGEHEATVRYEIHGDRVLKVQEGPRYDFIEGEELDRLLVATRLYYERVAREVYKREPATGAPLA